jgi:hypothetical protein
MSLWSGGRAIWEGVNPYDPESWVSLRVKYGSDWIPDDRAPFPMWTFLFSAPFALLDVGWGAATWLSFSLILLIFSLFLLIQSRGEPLPVWEFVLLLLGIFAFRPSLISINFGQITFLLTFSVLLFVYLVERGRAFAAGLALSLIVLKPTPFVLFAPIMAIWLLHQRRWRVIAGGVAGVLALLSISWLIQPGWITPWLSTRGKAEYAIVMPTVWGMAHDLWSTWWILIGGGVVISLTAVVGWLIVSDNLTDVVHVTALSLAVSLLCTPYAWVYEHVLLLAPLVFLFLRLRKRITASFIWIFFIFILPWFMYWIAEQRQLSTYNVIAPLLVSLVYYWLAVRNQGLSGRGQGVTNLEST